MPKLTRLAAPLFASILLGASPAPSERDLEKRFLSEISADSVREFDRRLSAEPHHIGSARGEENARWMLARFREWGFDASIETYYVLFPTPTERVVELVSPTRFRAALVEPTMEGDPTSSETAKHLPTYNAYSIDGDVTAQLVYVNYGVPADYERLERLGVDVKGKIAIARYGGSWRGIKPKVAAEHGAVGCLIYSDPRDDGYFDGDVYPRGAWRPEEGVQRGSVADMPLYPGDPLTPGVAATKDARRLDRSQAPTLTKIPVLPISYADARPLLAALGGPMAPPEWRGALPISYHVGPGPATVHVKLAFDWKIVPAHDVVARIPGSVWPDEWVMHGNHHDAWVYGASDPVSGLAALLEEARALGALRRAGWRPKRTIVLCAWDGEEPGLLGSTEFVEAHGDELERKAVLYVNTDSNGRGYLSAGGSHGLERLVWDVAGDVEDPEKKMPVASRWRAKEILDAKTAEERREVRERPTVRLSALGSGSDFTPFLQHAGVASLNLGYGGESDGGVYHSIYDDFTWYSRFSDGGFVYGRALAQTTGLVLLRVADADLLPFDFTPLSDAVRRYLTEVRDLAKKMRDDAEETRRQADEGTFSATSDPSAPLAPPKSPGRVPYFDFSPLETAADDLSAAARAFQAAAGRRGAEPGARAPGKVAAANAAIRSVERAMTRADGLPRRPWFRHYVYAPGFYTGYDVKTLPAVREAIEQREWKAVNGEIAKTADAIEAAAAKIREAATALE